MLLLTHRPCTARIFYGTDVADKEQGGHNASSAGYHRHAAGNLCGRCEDNNLVCAGYVAVEIGNDNARDCEETDIC